MSRNKTKFLYVVTKLILNLSHINVRIRFGSLEARVISEEFLQNTKRILSEITDKLLNVLNRIENMLPRPVAGLFNATVGNILRPILNIIRNFPNFVENVNKFIQNIQKEAYIVAEKLASVFGEIKNFIKDKLSEGYKKFTKKEYKMLNI